MASNFPVGPNDMGRHGASRVPKRMNAFAAERARSPSELEDVERAISAYTENPRKKLDFDRPKSPLLASDEPRSDGAAPPQPPFKPPAHLGLCCCLALFLGGLGAAAFYFRADLISAEEVAVASVVETEQKVATAVYVAFHHPHAPPQPPSPPHPSPPPPHPSPPPPSPPPPPPYVNPLTNPTNYYILFLCVAGIYSYAYRVALAALLRELLSLSARLWKRLVRCIKQLGRPPFEGRRGTHLPAAKAALAKTTGMSYDDMGSGMKTPPGWTKGAPGSPPWFLRPSPELVKAEANAERLRAKQAEAKAVQAAAAAAKAAKDAPPATPAPPSKPAANPTPPTSAETPPPATPQPSSSAQPPDTIPPAPPTAAMPATPPNTVDKLVA